MGHRIGTLLFMMLLLPAVFSCRQQRPTSIRLELGEKYAYMEMSFFVRDTILRLVTDSVGEGVMLIPEEVKVGYTGFFYGRGMLPLYIDPGKNLEITYIDGQFSFQGEGASKVIYLNNKFLTNLGEDYSLGEEEFITFLDCSLLERYRYLDSLGFDDRFVKEEKQRLYYSIYSRLPLYPSKHSECRLERFIELANAKMKEEEECVHLSEYTMFFLQMIDMNCHYLYPGISNSEMLHKQIEYIGYRIQGPRLSAYLTDLFMRTYIENHGIDGLDDLLDIYINRVTDPKMIGQFKDLYDRWAVVAKGKSAPDFCYRNIDGQEIRLSDLRGKYVYIDLWATWCYFCCLEIPDLKKLEKELEGRNIYFVSISCDQDVEAWKQKVEKERLGGIQLIDGGDNSFRLTFQAHGIPRFILLDPEGKIISPNAMRPSHPLTLQTLQNLPGI